MVVFLGLWILRSEPSAGVAEVQYEATDLTGQWSQVIEGISIPLESMENLQEVALGEKIVLEMTLPEIDPDTVLYFYSENQEVVVTVDQEEVYSFVIQDGYELLQTPGSTWNIIELTEEMSGATLRVEYTCYFKYYQLEIHEGYFVHKCNVSDLKFQEVGIFTIFALIILGLGIISYVNSYIWKNDMLKSFLWNMGNLYTGVGIWLLSELSFFDIFFHRPLLSYVISMIMLRILPIVCLKYFYAGMTRKYKVLDCLGVVSWCNLILSVILQFAFGVSFVSLLIINNALIVVGGVIIVVIYIANFLHMEKRGQIEDIFMVNGILIIAANIDILFYYQYSDYAVIMGGITASAFVMYALIAHIVLLNYETNTHQEKEKLQKENTMLQTATMMQQIKAHFIFNTLNTISALCKSDAHEADKAIRLLSRYLRSYMYLINQNHNIPFESEMELVKSYLEIEKLRFGESFVFQIQVEYSDFVLPPLSIQPLVENAMNHGLRKDIREGEISVRVRKEEAYVKIVIQDNGVGFFPSEIEEKQSIGINNVKKRIEYMTDGTLEIDSIINEGTEIIISLPLEEV